MRHVAEVFDCEAVVLLPDDDGTPAVPAAARRRELVPRRGSLGRAVGRRSRPAGRPRHRHAAGRAGALPAARRARASASACSAVLPRNRRRVLLPEQRHLLETFAGQIGLALERAQLGDEAAKQRASPPRARACATRCSRRSRTTCARRSPSWPAAASTLARHERRARRSHARRARRVDRGQGARDVRAHLERARPDAPRVGPGRAAPRLGDASTTSSASALRRARAAAARRTRSRSTFRAGPARRARRCRADRAGLRQPARQRR